MPLRTEVGLVPGNIALDGTHLSQRGGGQQPPLFGPCIVAKQLDGSRCHLARRPWPRQDYVRWGHSCLTKKGDSPPQFLAHVCCGQMAGLIKMPLGIGVGFGPGDIVLDGDPAPP